MDTREFGGEAFGKGVHMPKSTGLRYTEEFKAEAVQLARSSFHWAKGYLVAA